MPNAIGYLRLLALPVFLIAAFSSSSGPGAAAIVLYCLIAGGDYLDGIAARLTGQYSRLGALMDPVVDRLTILSGAAVTWHFDLLPRWGIALLVAREAAMLVIAQAGLRRGVDISINWPGRIAVFPVMGSFPLAMAWPGPLADGLLIVGLALALAATALYVRTGLAAR